MKNCVATEVMVVCVRPFSVNTRHIVDQRFNVSLLSFSSCTPSLSLSRTRYTDGEWVHWVSPDPLGSGQRTKGEVPNTPLLLVVSFLDLCDKLFMDYRRSPTSLNRKPVYSPDRVEKFLVNLFKISVWGCFSCVMTIDASTIWRGRLKVGGRRRVVVQLLENRKKSSVGVGGAIGSMFDCVTARSILNETDGFL